MITLRTIKYFAIITFVFANAGCALLPTFGISDKTEMTTYVLHAPEVSKRAVACGTTLIGAVSAAPGYSGAGLLYSTDETQVKRYAYAKWADTLPRILRSVVAQTLDDSGAFSAVLNGPVPSSTDYRIDLVDVQLVQHYEHAEADSSVMKFNATVRVFGINPNVLLHTERVTLEDEAGVGPQEAVRTTQQMLASFMPNMIETVAGACLKK